MCKTGMVGRNVVPDGWMAEARRDGTEVGGCCCDADGLATPSSGVVRVSPKSQLGGVPGISRPNWRGLAWFLLNNVDRRRGPAVGMGRMMGRDERRDENGFLYILDVPVALLIVGEGSPGRLQAPLVARRGKTYDEDVMGWGEVDMGEPGGSGPGRNMVSTGSVGKLGGHDQVSPRHLWHIQTAGTLP